ncbi:alpha-ketoglutarate-dependent dioxygenase AlkB family protein [Microlunatus soli]|uniref:Alkylated DNA repair dioxygenase AlkB n=1 Tax=Microlunatus soli TaxID=630515 RepID=A0A1H1V1X2_9ACTN|nr:alpha-ketoglutarate-dependent dioxygenase AlkB [Microlunatus soli]SDS78199.1 Alkylated DNA repair dioxygenase AlkB [Microlunatus soli]
MTSGQQRGRAALDRALPSCVRYLPGWVADHRRIFAELVEVIDWERNDITIAGRTIPIPRLTCWMGTSQYVYSGVRNEPRPTPAALTALQQQVQVEAGATFNSCLANLYRDGHDSISYHSDDEPELGRRPTIASISLGDRRRFVLRHQDSGERWELELGAGDLLIMSGESQSDYRHAVPKTMRPVGQRMNLTFRQFAT